VVLATGISLECGLARQLLLQWGIDPRNAVLFMQPPRVRFCCCLCCCCCC
jgi:hypothetical protein